MQKKVGGVILSHGQLASGLLSAAETVVGELPFITAVTIGWHDDLETVRDEIARAVKQVDSGKGVLILTDMFGGAPTNIAAMFLSDKVEILTGVNLPMVIKLGRQTLNADLHFVAQEVIRRGREEIYLASELLAPPKQKKNDK
jgi:PTS system mannose-specific IIA component